MCSPFARLRKINEISIALSCFNNLPGNSTHHWLDSSGCNGVASVIAIFFGLALKTNGIRLKNTMIQQLMMVRMHELFVQISDK